MTPVLDVFDLRKAFTSGQTLINAVSGVSLSLLAGEIVGIVGPQGSGKTTLLRCVAGLIRADSGRISWFGSHFAGGGCLPGLSFVPNTPDYYPFLTAPDALDYHVESDATAPSVRRATILDALRSVGLSTVLHMQVRELYASQVAAVAVAEALASKPKVIVIDGALDTAELRELIAIRAALLAFANCGGVVIIASRRAELFDGFASRIVEMRAGAIVRQAAPTSSVEAGRSAFAHSVSGYA